jgi:hypothetical protein
MLHLLQASREVLNDAMIHKKMISRAMISRAMICRKGTNLS